MSNPVPESPVPKEGETFATLTNDGREQFMLVPQQPSDFFLVRADAGQQHMDTAANAADSKDGEQGQERIFFKHWFRPPVPAPVVTFVQPVPAPTVVRAPQPVVLGTIYQPFRLIAAPIPTAPLVAGAIPSPVSALPSFQPSTLPVARPSAGLFPGNVDINIQQVMRPFGGAHPSGIAPMPSGAVPIRPSSAAAVAGTAGVAGVGGMETMTTPTPGITIDKVIDVMGQVSRT